MNKKAFALSTLIMILIVALAVGIVLTKWAVYVVTGLLFCVFLMFIWFVIYEEVEQELREREWRKKIDE